MYLNYSQIAFDKDGRIEYPELMLQAKSGKRYGTIPGVSGLKLNIKLSEPSEISFQVASRLTDGSVNPLYDKVVGHRIVYTEHYGIYVLSEPQETMDGVSASKDVKGYSIERELDNKQFFIEEGTFNFYNPADTEDTVLGRILEEATDWSVGYVSPSLLGRYRTFDEYSGAVLTLMYGDISEKFRCVFVFDPYTKKVNVYDADERRTILPIYLDFDNLVEQLGIKELTDELVTAIRPSGADDMTVQNVNPTGSQFIYDLSYFIANGDISGELAEKYDAWQKAVLDNQTVYKSLVALRSSATSERYTKQAELTELENELTGLINQQSIIVQQMANDTAAGRAALQQQLNQINEQIAAKQTQITAKQSEIDALTEQIEGENSYKSQIESIVNTLNPKKYFTEAEYQELSRYFIEQDLSDGTFVSTGFMERRSGESVDVDGKTVSVTGSSIQRVDVTQFNKTMYMITGGKFNMGDILTGDIIRSTVEVNGTKFVMSVYLGSVVLGETAATSGTVTISGTLNGSVTGDITGVTQNELTEYLGTQISIPVATGKAYVTFSVSDFQEYSVESELFDYGVEVLSDKATPTYEFSVDSANFLFTKEFAPFRNRLELGSAVHLRIGDDKVITPIAIEIELDFDNESNFSLLFSNRFKRHDAVNTLKDVIEKSYSTSRTFEANKYIYGQTTKQTDTVSKFLSSSLDAAANAIKAARDQNVVIDGSGIRIFSNKDAPDKRKNIELRMTDGMIAMSDNNWRTAKLAIGYFNTEDVGEYFGVNAEVIGGKLVVANDLIIENPKLDGDGNPTGVMQFKVNSNGAWLNNSTFVLQKDGGGKIIFDPKYGILGGTGDLYTVNGTTVTPSFDPNGTGTIAVKETNGMPKSSKFFLDLTNGDAYFNGKVFATGGQIGGFTIENDYLHAGSRSSFVALNGSGSNDNSDYAIWAGGENPAAAKFSVKKNGDLFATDGTFKGTIDGAKLSGNLTPASTGTDDGWIKGCGIKVGGTEANPAFQVDKDGNVVLKGNITWSSSSTPVKYQFSTNGTSGWHDTMTSSDMYRRDSLDGGNTWGSAYQFRGTNGKDGADGADGSDATVNATNVFNVLTNNGTKFGCFTNGDGSLYINATYINSGIINANLVTLGFSTSGFSYASGHDGNSTTYGAKMYTGTNYVIVTNAGARMTAGQEFYVTSGVAHCSTTISTGSDRRIKNSINYDMDSYDKFFMNLKPAFYKMNNGTSGRFHTGFIAQDVEAALLDGNESTTDFAGLVIKDYEQGKDNSGKDYSLRYSEFVALNTHMIQKLYKRVDELERKLKENTNEE